MMDVCSNQRQQPDPQKIFGDEWQSEPSMPRHRPAAGRCEKARGRLVQRAILSSRLRQCK